MIALPAKYVQFRHSFYLPDNKLDKSEATAKKCGFTEEEFLEADVNKNGQFEYKDVGLIDKVRLFHEVDEDSNGKLDFYEWIKVDYLFPT